MTTRNFCELLMYKTRSNLRAEVSRLYLNYVWWVLEPLLAMGVFYVVFGVFMNSATPHFALFLLIGLIQWQWFANTVLHAAGSIRASAGLMLQVDIPKVFFPLEVFLQDSFKHLFVLGLFAAFLSLYPIPATAAWCALVPVLLVQALWIAAMSILCAALVPFVPDLQHILATCMNILFFISGIFFDVDIFVLPEHQSRMFLNPMAGLLREYRNIILHGVWPDWTYVGKILLGTLALLGLALYVIRRCDRIYPRLCQQ